MLKVHSIESFELKNDLELDLFYFYNDVFQMYILPQSWHYSNKLMKRNGNRQNSRDDKTNSSLFLN